MGKFVIRRTNTGIKFDLKAGNGEVIATSEVYSSEENVCYIEITDELENWEKAQKMFAECVRKYLESGKYAEVLKSAKAVGIGFVDGDIEILYLDGKII